MNAFICFQEMPLFCSGISMIQLAQPYYFESHPSDTRHRKKLTTPSNLGPPPHFWSDAPIQMWPGQFATFSSTAAMPYQLIGIEKEHSMASNNQGGQNNGSDKGKGTQGGTHEQHVEAGRQSHKNDHRDDNSGQSANSGGQGGQQNSSGSSKGTQGGTHEQHVEAGRQSHKNDDARSGQSASGKNDSSGHNKSGSH